MAGEHIGQPEEETSAQTVDKTGGAAEPQESAQVKLERDHDYDHLHAQEHEHEHHKRAWYATLGEDWLATIAGVLLVVLLVFRVLHAIP